jgi:hypothetical protein
MSKAPTVPPKGSEPSLQSVPAVDLYAALDVFPLAKVLEMAARKVDRLSLAA